MGKGKDVIILFNAQAGNGGSRGRKKKIHDKIRMRDKMLKGVMEQNILGC